MAKAGGPPNNIHRDLDQCTWPWAATRILKVVGIARGVARFSS